MAQANISVTENQFRCCVCLDILRDPVSIPCGHTYCMVCISNYWDQAESGQFSCPQCRDMFSPRPVLRRNTVLAEVVDKFKMSELVQDPELYLGEAGEVACDFCPAESRLRAGKSCLVCLASFCDLHVLPHREVGPLRRHKLVDAVVRLAEKLCAQHRSGLEPAGSGSDPEAEWSGDCLLCEEERRVDTPKARRQLQLQESQRMVQGRVRSGERDLEDLQQNLESLNVLSSAVLEESEALFDEIAQRLEKTKNEVRVLLEAKGRAAVGRMERDIEILEKDLEKLRKRDEEISQLLQTEDNVRLSQVTRAAPLLCSPLTADPLSRAFSLPTEAFGDARKALSHLRRSIEDTCTEGVDKISRAGNENYVFGGELVNDSCRLSLDSNTAHPTLLLLEDPQGAHCGEDTQPHPPHPHRFDSVAQVLCREGQFGAASYWEVEWRGGGWVDIAITTLSIGRKGGGKPCLLGRNENSWRLRCTHTGYSAWHDNRKTTVAAPPCPRIGVLLERQKGALSFYSVSDTVVLLHTFHSQFSQPLYPAFRFDLDSTLLICPHEGANASRT